MASDTFQYRAIFEYKRERGDDINLQTGDLLTVPKASWKVAPGQEYQEGDERSPKGWLHGTNERTKEKGDFPGTFVEYVGVMRVGLPVAKSWPRPVPPTPGGQLTGVGPQPPGAAAASGECCPLKDRKLHDVLVSGFVCEFKTNISNCCTDTEAAFTRTRFHSHLLRLHQKKLFWF